MTLRDDLIAAKALISDPTVWVKHPGACGESYCAITSLAGVFFGRHEANVGERQRQAWDALGLALPVEWAGQRVGSYNDDPSTTHADIMALFDRAIAKASPSPSEALGG